MYKVNWPTKPAPHLPLDLTYEVWFYEEPTKDEILMAWSQCRTDGIFGSMPKNSWRHTCVEDWTVEHV